MGGQGLRTRAELEAAILRAWERRWPGQKWREEIKDSEGVTRRGDYTEGAKAKAAEAVDAVWDWYAHRG